MEILGNIIGYGNFLEMPLHVMNLSVTFHIFKLIELEAEWHP